ncbi:MAG: redoxin family protein [Pseudomonadales bacterium]|nr:redoxin family protein [Pseudomonadales bacterium]
MNSNKFSAAAQFPSITLNTLGGDQLDIGKAQAGYSWQMVVVYRGLHCPLCTAYLKQLESLKQKFYANGIGIVAVSADPQHKAASHNEKMQLSFPIAYDLSIAQMQTLGLYISHPRSEQETDRPFSEPGLYIINEQGQVQVTDISNAPFTRPELESLASGLDFIRDADNNYPIRGTY